MKTKDCWHIISRMEKLRRLSEQVDARVNDAVMADLLHEAIVKFNELSDSRS